MVLAILGGAALVAFGLLAIYFSVEEEKDDFSLLVVLVVGIVSVAAGGWLILSSIPLATLLTKLAGLVLTLAGLFLVISFPGVTDYQKEAMGKTGIFFGIIILIVGIYLLIF